MLAPVRNNLLTGSVVAFLCVLGGGVGLDAACSPSNPTPTDAGPVCDPDSGDPSGCPCDPNKPSVDCYSGPAGTSNKGICKAGKRSCNDGKFTTCVGEVTPLPETCNYTDDDCNGYVDDLFADAAVLAHCNSPACSPNFPDAAITCWGPDPGICGAGTLACQGGPRGGTPNGCNEFIHTPAMETCNGIDDDCNGTIDDGLDQEGPCTLDDGSMWPADANPFEGGKPTLILGACANGNLTCVDTACDEHGCKDAGDQCMPTQPAPETCDGLDNDCNGQTDEHSCSTAPAGNQFCCTSGTYHTCAPSYYTTYGYTCYDAGP
jgi:hypothetical protein